MSVADLTVGEMSYIRDVLKEASECDDIDDVRYELIECVEIIEEILKWKC